MDTILIRENFENQDTIQPRYFNKKIKFKLHIKTQYTNYGLNSSPKWFKAIRCKMEVRFRANSFFFFKKKNYGLKLKRKEKKESVKHIPNRHKTTIRHINEIAFT